MWLGNFCLIGAFEGRGQLAQLVERLIYTEDVGGSNPSLPTKLRSCGAALGKPKLKNWASGEIGIHAALRWLWEQSCAGSSPVSPTK